MVADNLELLISDTNLIITISKKSFWATFPPPSHPALSERWLDRWEGRSCRNKAQKLQEILERADAGDGAMTSVRTLWVRIANRNEKVGLLPKPKLKSAGNLVAIDDWVKLNLVF